MQKKLAVLVIHGMGTQERKRPDPVTGLYYSNALYARLGQVWDAHRLTRDVAWKEVRWSSVFDNDAGDNRQTVYLDTLARDLPAWGLTWTLRKLVMERIADAAAYAHSTRPDSVYERVHGFIDNAMEELEAEVSPDAPLVILAHSLGAHIISNYIYDVVQKTNAPRPRPTAFQSFQSLGNFVSFGANIPVFTFSLPKVEPIRFPVKDAAAPQGWWRNYYSRFDPLGYPLRPVPGYQEVLARGEIFEERLDVGSMLTRFTPLSHNAYWNAPPMARRIAEVFDAHL